MFLDHCSLCNVANKQWQRGRFFGIESCDTHEGQPLIVLYDHRAKLTPDEQEEMERLAQEYWPGTVGRGYMQKLPGHWHNHRILP